MRILQTAANYYLHEELAWNNRFFIYSAPHTPNKDWYLFLDTRDYRYKIWRINIRARIVQSLSKKEITNFSKFIEHFYNYREAYLEIANPISDYVPQNNYIEFKMWAK